MNIMQTYHTAMRLNRDFLPLFHPSTLFFILLYFSPKKMTSELANGPERATNSFTGLSLLPFHAKSH